MRPTVLIALILALVGCGAGSAGGSGGTAPATDLSITYWPQGRAAGMPTRWTLRCNPTGGTLPRAASACTKLGAMRAPFAPLPKDAICTQQYGGPQIAVISGSFRGGRIWTRLSARDGCEISRAKRLGFLVPGFGADGA